MSEQMSFVEEGIDRIQNAVDSVEGEFQKLQKNVLKRRKSFEKEAQKRVKRVRAELRKSPVVKRAQSLRKDLNQQFEDWTDGLFAVFPYARREDVTKLENKVSQLTKKLNQLEKANKTSKATATPGEQYSDTRL
jgi:ubiquinone biosynthesis protein UbiJ